MRVAVPGCGRDAVVLRRQWTIGWWFSGSGVRLATCDLDSPVDSRNPLASSRSKEGGLTYHGILWWGKGGCRVAQAVVGWNALGNAPCLQPLRIQARQVDSNSASGLQSGSSAHARTCSCSGCWPKEVPRLFWKYFV
jgi:hypothetical protein